MSTSNTTTVVAAAATAGAERRRLGAATPARSGTQRGADAGDRSVVLETILWIEVLEAAARAWEDPRSIFQEFDPGDPRSKVMFGRV